MTSTVQILVVDDEPDVEALITQRFRREIRKNEMSFVFAYDGEDALEKLGENPDILMVLSDINMPRMDGLTLLARLGESHQYLKTVVVSAYGDMGNIRTAMNRGAFDFLTKPLDFGDLEATIRKTLSHLDEYRSLQRDKAEAELAKVTLSRYFSPSVAESLANAGAGSQLGGERREATFLFTDLAGFTKLIEGTDPAIVMRLLNGYLDGVAKIIFSHDGTVMKVIGDAVHAIFGAPVSQKDHAARAVACALDIDDFSEAFRADWIKQGVDLGLTRVGINTGDAIIGNFGGDSYFDYSAYGDAVNLAARLEAANKVLGTRICISECVVQQIDGFCGRPAGKLNIAGKTEPIMAFEPLRADRAASEDMAQYQRAYDKMAAGDEDAKSAFAALMSRMPDDPLVLLHLQRTLGGKCTDTIAEVVK